MKDPIQFFWLIAIVVTLANAITWWCRGRASVVKNPELAAGYNKLITVFAISGSIPWLVMGCAVLIGGVRSVQDFLRPWQASPWVLAWYAAGLCIWLFWLWWLFRRDGAKTLVDYPGLFNFPLTNPRHVKVFALVATAGVIGGLIVVDGGAIVPHWTTRADGYKTVFTIYEGFCRWLALGILFVALGIGALILSVKWRQGFEMPEMFRPKGQRGANILLLWSIVWLLIGVPIFLSIVGESYLLLHRYRTGQALRVEGTVHVLREQPYNGHAPGDLVEIGGIRFDIDAFGPNVGYRSTIAHGGALAEGKFVRLWYYEGSILRVEVREPSSQGSPG